MGRKEAPTTIQDSVSGICTRVSAFFLHDKAQSGSMLNVSSHLTNVSLGLQIDEATKEETSGHFVLYEDGSKLPW